MNTFSLFTRIMLERFKLLEQERSEVIKALGVYDDELMEGLARIPAMENRIKELELEIEKLVKERERLGFNAQNI